jgi:hypothetical protein
VAAVTLSSPGAAAAAPPASYAITPSAAAGTGLENYTISYQPGTLTVTATEPTITCPAAIVTNQAAGQCSQVVPFAPIVTGNPAPVLVCDLNGDPISSPFSFPVGTNAVFCTASNAAGVQSCAFTVTVLDTNPPVAGTVALGTRQGQTASLAVTNVLLNDTSGNGGPLSITSVVPTTRNGGSVALGNGLITYAPAATFAGLDTIDYTLSDGCGTAQGSIIVAVTYTNLPSENTVSIMHTATNTTIIFAGTPAAVYQVETAASPTGPWISLGNAVQAAGNGLIESIDTTFPPPQTRFYRTRYVSGP